MNQVYDSTQKAIKTWKAKRYCNATLAYKTLPIRDKEAIGVGLECG
jgi:hypothetical protein